MADTIKLEIVTPHGLTFSGEVNELTATGTEGEFGVLPGHTSLITTLGIGMLTYKKDREIGYFFVSGGYTEVEADKVTILADSAERSENIDIERALSAMKRAEERLRQADNIDFVRAQTALSRATIRIQVAEKRSAK